MPVVLVVDAAPAALRVMAVLSRGEGAQTEVLRSRLQGVRPALESKRPPALFPLWSSRYGRDVPPTPTSWFNLLSVPMGRGAAVDLCARLGGAEQAQHHRRGVTGEPAHLGQRLAPGLVEFRAFLDRRLVFTVSHAIPLWSGR